MQFTLDQENDGLALPCRDYSADPRDRDRGGRHAGLAARVQPAEFIGMPAVMADERQVIGLHTDFRARAGARNREQQSGVVPGRVGDLAAEAGILGGIHALILAVPAEAGVPKTAVTVARHSRQSCP